MGGRGRGWVGVAGERWAHQSRGRVLLMTEFRHVVFLCNVIDGRKCWRMLQVRAVRCDDTTLVA